MRAKRLKRQVTWVLIPVFELWGSCALIQVSSATPTPHPVDPEREILPHPACWLRMKSFPFKVDLELLLSQIHLAMILGVEKITDLPLAQGLTLV